MIPIRKDLRLRNYDYSCNGAYFVTICAQERGETFNNKYVEEILLKYLLKLEEKFTNLILDEFVIINDHVHFIIILDNEKSVGVDPCVYPDENNFYTRVNTRVDPYNNKNSIFNIIQWYKTMTTNEYIRMVKNNILPPFNKRIWQRNYYEHIIRNANELNEIRQYIINNPLQNLEKI